MAFSFPFEFNNPSISSWLSQLSSTDVIAAAHDVFKVINKLKKEVDDIDRESLELIVERLTPVVIHTSTFLEKVFFDKNENFTTQQRKIVQLNTLLIRYLAFLHIYLAEHTSDIESKVLHANYGAQLIGHALYISTLSYEIPAFSLWNMLGDVYKIALSNNILDEEIKKPLPAFNQLLTISSVLNRVFLFSIGDNYKLSHQQIKHYFDFCLLNYELLVFDKLSVKNSLGFCWRYASGQKPFPITSKSNENPASKLEVAATGKVVQPELFFNVEPLLSAFNYSVVDVPFDASVGIEERLSNYQSINEAVFSLPRLSIYLFGFEQITEFFSRFIRKNVSSTFKPPTVDELNFSSLGLIPTQQKQHQQNSDGISNIWGDNEPVVESIELAFGAQKAYQTKLPGFLVVEWIKVGTCFDGLILMYGKDKKLIVAIVRRVEKELQSSPRKNHLNSIRKGVIEVLQGSVTLVKISNGLGNKNALLLTQDHGHELILAADRYVTGSALKLKQGKVVLDKLLEYTPYFVRYAVSLKEYN